MNFDPRASVRARLAFWNVITLIVILTLFGAALRFGVEQVMQAALDRQLETMVEPIAHFFQSPPPPPESPDRFDRGRTPDDFRGPGGPDDPGGPGIPGDRRDLGGPPDGPHFHDGDPNRPFDPREGMGPPFRDRRRRPPNQGMPPGLFPVRVFPPDQESMAYLTTALQAVRDLRPHRDDTEYNGEPVRVYTLPIVRNGHVERIIQIAGSLTPARKAVDGVTATTLYLIPLVLLLAGGGALALTNSALKPVRDLTLAADRIEGANLSERLPVRGNDEFAQLAGILNAMLGRIETAFARQKRFTADASHELRTPLAVIKAHTSLHLDDDTSTTEELRNALQTIDTASDRAQRIVQDLLLLARGESGTLPVQWSPVILNDVLAAAARSVQTAHPGPLAPITIDAPADTRLIGDRDHLTRLFINLLDNAVRHTPAEGKVCVNVTTARGTITATVTDTGEGIAPEHLARLMEPFYRVDAARARKSGGSGLGLSICKTITDAHDGTLSIASQPGKGTTVTVTLPTSPARK